MQVTNIFGKEFTTIATLKAFCIEHGIDTKGIKLKADWIAAVESYMEVQAEVIATAKDAEIAAELASKQIETAAVAVGAVVVAALTSDTAIGIYRGLLRALMVAIVFAVFIVGKFIKWCWDNRHRTAVYHWVIDAIDSRMGRGLITHGLIAEWIAMQWRDTAVKWCRDRTAYGLSRLGRNPLDI
jgi:hypothetical protein